MFYKVDGIVNGATRQKLTQAAMRKMQIPSRSMDEQKQIAQIIGTLLSKIAREQRMLNCYAAQRQYLLRQMFI